MQSETGFLSRPSHQLKSYVLLPCTLPSMYCCTRPVHTAVYYTARVHGMARTRPLDGRVRAENTAVYTCTRALRPCTSRVQRRLCTTQTLSTVVYTTVRTAHGRVRVHDRAHGQYMAVYGPCTLNNS